MVTVVIARPYHLPAHTLKRRFFAQTSKITTVPIYFTPESADMTRATA